MMPKPSSVYQSAIHFHPIASSRLIRREAFFPLVVHLHSSFLAAHLPPTVAPQIMKIKVYFGGHSGDYISQTRFGLLHGRHVRMSCQQRQISTVGKSSMTQLAKSMVWKLKLVDMHCGTAQMLVKSGSLLSFQSNTMGYSLTPS